MSRPLGVGMDDAAAFAFDPDGEGAEALRPGAESP